MSYRGLDTPPVDNLSEHTKYLRSIRDMNNNLLIGKQNITLDFTLTANVASSTVQDPRIGGSSAISIGMPLTANAAAAMPTTYVPLATITQGQAIIQHANNAQTDRTFRLLIQG